uniref:NADP-dependent oxidoreductase domain-containing protein n=1 Tax=Sinocyclocheilus anshuiensis TaxID=1608454 RepID=A0A671NST5_9TELE
MKSLSTPSVLLNTGTWMPLLGLGTFHLQGQEDSYNAVDAALTAAQLDQGSKARDGCLRSLEQLGLGYIDLYLIHWPGTQGLPGGINETLKTELKAGQSWKSSTQKENFGLLGFLITQ